MDLFSDFNISKQLQYALDDLGYTKPTPIQSGTYSTILSGRDVVGIAQTGTGKTFAYLLPTLQNLKYSKEAAPRVVILVPTRELVVQVVENIKLLTKYKEVRTIGVYGGTNIRTQKIAVMQGADIVVGTPGRLYDLALSGALSLKLAKKLIIDEVDVMLDMGFVFQLTNILELLPAKRQNIMFSATMTDHVDLLIEDFFVSPEKVSIAVSGTPLHNIAQSCIKVKNFYTKANLLAHLLSDKEEFNKVLVFVSSKKNVDRLHTYLDEELMVTDMSVIHSNKSQNYRLRSIEDFDKGKTRVLLTTDVMARGLDLHQISHVINYDTPRYPENYMHRIGRTGRAEHEGKAILLYTEQEQAQKEAIESLMDYSIPDVLFPTGLVEESERKIPDEQPKLQYALRHDRNEKKTESQGAFHEKKAKNNREKPTEKKYRRELAKKYKKPQRRGDKIQNMAAKKRKKRK